MSKVSVLTEEPDAAERRRFDRVEATVRVDYASVDELFSEFTRDINEGGLFIETSNPLDLGGRVSLQFALPDSDETIRARGTVMWVQPGGADQPAGMGVEFDDLDPAERAKINEFVRHLRQVPTS